MLSGLPRRLDCGLVLPVGGLRIVYIYRGNVLDLSENHLLKALLDHLVQVNRPVIIDAGNS